MKNLRYQRHLRMKSVFCFFKYLGSHHSQSVSSNWKTSSTFFSNTLAIFRARTVEGTYFPCSIALIVWRLTCTSSASCCWVIRLIALSTLILFIIHCPPELINGPLILYNKEQQEAEHVDGHEGEIRKTEYQHGSYNQQTAVHHNGPHQ